MHFLVSPTVVRILTDTGMMSTLFIGPQDYVFRWEDNMEWMIGLLVGFVISSVVLLVFRRSRLDYEPVTMNELKSKTMD